MWKLYQVDMTPRAGCLHKHDCLHGEEALNYGIISIMLWTGLASPNNCTGRGKERISNWQEVKRAKSGKGHQLWLYKLPPNYRTWVVQNTIPTVCCFSSLFLEVWLLHNSWEIIMRGEKIHIHKLYSGVSKQKKLKLLPLWSPEATVKIQSSLQPFTWHLGDYLTL